MKLLTLSLFLYFFCFHVEASPKRNIPEKNNIAVLLEVYTHPLGTVQLIDKAGEKNIYLLLFEGGLCKLQWIEGRGNCVIFSSLKEVLRKKDCILSFSGKIPACEKKINSDQIRRDYSF